MLDTTLLDRLEVQAQSLRDARLPTIVALALTSLGAIGLLTGKPLFGIVGWLGGLPAGLYAISLTARGADSPGLLKYPAFVACFVPGLALVAVGVFAGVLQRARSANDDAVDRETRALRVQQRQGGQARASAPGPARGPAPPPPMPPAGAASAVAPPARTPVPEQALPVVRAVFDAEADPDANVQISAGPERPPGVSDSDWALFNDAVGPVARGAGHFLVMYRMDNGASWLFVNEDVREQSGLTRDGLHRKAMQNLNALVRRPGQLRVVDNPPYKGFLLDGEHESSLVLVDELWRMLLRSDCPNGVVVTIPARDLCAFCDAGSPEGIIALREMAARFRGQRGEVSQQLMLFTAEGWSAFR